MAAGRGPRDAIRDAALQQTTPAARKQFLRAAALDAILGATRKCMGSVRSGITCWMDFVEKWDPELLRYFPPPLELLLAYTMAFRSPHTLRNYLGHLKTGCLVVGASVEAEACRCGCKNSCGTVFPSGFQPPRVAKGQSHCGKEWPVPEEGEDVHLQVGLTKSLFASLRSLLASGTCFKECRPSA